MNRLLLIFFINALIFCFSAFLNTAHAGPATAPNGSYNSLTNGTWTSSGGTATWERKTAGVWNPSAAPAFNTTSFVYINSTISITGSASPANVVVQSAGYLSVNSACTFGTSLLIEFGGNMAVYANINVTGTFEIRDHGTLGINYRFANPATSIWAGVEHFHEMSRIAFGNWDCQNDKLLIDNTTITPNISPTTGDTAVFGLLDFSFGNNLGANDDWVLLENGVTVKLAHSNISFYSNSNPAAEVRFSNSGTVSSGTGPDGAIWVYPGWTSPLILKGGGTSLTFETGWVIVEGGLLRVHSNASGTSTLTIKHDLAISNSGIVDFNNVVNINAVSIINLDDDFTITGAGLLANSNTARKGIFRFSMPGGYDYNFWDPIQSVDVFTTNVTNNRNISFVVESAHLVQLTNHNFELGNNSDFTVRASMFDFSFSGSTALVIKEVSSGAANTAFTLEDGSGIKITSPNGIDAHLTYTAQGNVWTDSRTYSTSGVYYYAGRAPSQRLGDGLPTVSAPKLVIIELDALSTYIVFEGYNGSAYVPFSSDIAISNGGGRLDIRQGTVTGTEAIDFVGTGRLFMSGGLYRMNEIAAVSMVPQLSGSRNIQGGTIELYGNNVTQILKGTITSGIYNNLLFSGSNTLGVNAKYLSDNVRVLGKLEVTGTAIVDCQNGSGVGTSFIDNGGIVMSGGRMRFLKQTNPQPELTGVLQPYSITGGVMEFYANAAGNLQLIKGTATNPIVYNEIEVTGSAVGVSTSDIILGNAGKLTVKSTGILEINDKSISGPTFANQSVIVETGGKIRTGDVDGFSGTANTSIQNTIETVTLQTGTTVEYSRSAPAFTNGNQVITNAHIYKNLSLAGTGIKTAPPGTLTVQENLTKNSTDTFAHNNGLVLLNGTTQSFAGMDYYDLEINGNTKTTNGSSSIASLLQVNAASTLAVNANDSITLSSTPTLTARVAPLHASANILYNGSGATKGKFVVERSLVNNRRWRLLSAPTINNAQTIRNSWLEDGASPAGYGCIAADTRADFAARGFDLHGNNSSVKKFNPVLVKWDSVDNLNSSLISSELGYMIFVAGDRYITYPGSNPTRLRTKGQLYRESDLSTITVTANQFKLLGNPFASRIDLRNINTSGLDAAFYIWDPGIGGNYGLGAFNTFYKSGADYKNLLASSIYGAAGTTNNYVESGMAFFVKAGSGGATVNFDEGDKTAGSALSAFMANEATGLMVNLQQTDQTGNMMLIDGVMANFDGGNSNGPDANDIKKMKTFGENISWTTADSLLVIDRRADIAVADTLQLNMTNMKYQAYQWEIILNDINRPDVDAYLLDRYTQTESLLAPQGTTTIHFSVINDPSSYSAARFAIIFKQAVSGPVALKFISVSASRISASRISVVWKVENEMNVVDYTLERSMDGQRFESVQTITAAANSSAYVSYKYNDNNPGKADNFYRIRANDADGHYEYSEIVKVKSASIVPGISIYPNPGNGRNIHVLFDGMQRGIYLFRLLNAEGQVIHLQTFNLAGSSVVTTINPPETLSPGVYYLDIYDETGSRKTMKLIVK